MTSKTSEVVLEQLKKQDWAQPVFMTIPKGGTFPEIVEEGRYGPIFPKTACCYGFSIFAKVKPGKEEAFYEHAQNVQKQFDENPTMIEAFEPLKLHYLRWVLIPWKNEMFFMYQAVFDTDFDKYIEDIMPVFASGLEVSFVNLEGWPEDWRTNIPAQNKFFREHHCPAFMEYASYPFVSADEVRKALKLKAAFSTVLDQMQ
ncbi:MULTISPECIES: hypothetical protein [unclassified Mesorhizobium]|uniref:hypothetical protein n=1 Tax=unclassified Mesorhizobium TaxID=325217 RepID=UPI000FDAAD8D|nr:MULTISPECIES: hypothetical protein [unclassified Mesorhizobium]TGQ08682.1 hypothetical protein EN862_020740 [Mesorhizobium sp. M2E.F.Ca.ET.219.01.1.1]TGS09648.1 hypothetical protein EN852_030020 [Mesorhizobium sp. M2E.F.Ca.ET.209.01.1.1]TGT69217.1 hypothetical protein EN809_023020 [Mesorhizobium sp. M2E.F.Ca.ET.166.01.1.1]TGW01550.1 hypothetical protein EN797_014515 [Mesorhizobium sp. M2E.F.Ca.ET.154.01.1.1]